MLQTTFLMTWTNINDVDKLLWFNCIENIAQNGKKIAP
jgi:hypothetical protein